MVTRNVENKQKRVASCYFLELYQPHSIGYVYVICCLLSVFHGFNPLCYRSPWPVFLFFFPFPLSRDWIIMMPKKKRGSPFSFSWIIIHHVDFLLAFNNYHPSNGFTLLDHYYINIIHM